MSDRIVSTFSRLTSSGRFIPEIDGLRFIAIFSVIVAHVCSDTAEHTPPSGSSIDQFIYHAACSGVVGVKIFFAISGYILALPFAEARLGEGAPVRLSSYYKRRLLRIEPPYVINLAILTILALLVHGGQRFERLPHLLASLAYVHNFVYGSWSEINFVAWSLEIEVQFYLLAPLLAMVFACRRRPLRLSILVVTMLGCGIAAAWAEPLPYRIRMILPFHLQYFLAGFLLVEIFVVNWREHPLTGPGWTVLATAAWIAIYATATRSHLEALTAVLIFVAFYASFRSAPWRGFLANRWVAVFGGMCYTIYLYHFWVYSIYSRGIARLQHAKTFSVVVLRNSVIGAPFILVTCALLFVVLEKPFMRRDWPSRAFRALRRQERS